MCRMLRLFVVPVILALTSCGSGSDNSPMPSKKRERDLSALHGTWTAEPGWALESFRNSAQYRDMPSNLQAQAESGYRENVEQAMRFEISTGEIVVREGKFGALSGQSGALAWTFVEAESSLLLWQVISRESHTWTLETKLKTSEPNKEARSVVLVWVDENNIRVTGERKPVLPDLAMAHDHLLFGGGEGDRTLHLVRRK